MEAPLAAITASSLLGYVCISFAHLDLGIFSHSSLQICSNSVKLDQEHQSGQVRSQGSSPDDGIGAKPSGPPFFDRRKSMG